MIHTCREEIERERRLPLHLVDALKKAGVFRMTMPRAWGGAELDPVSQLRIIEALSAADASVGWCVMIGCDSGYFSGFLDQQIARETYPDIDAVTGSALTLTGRAVRSYPEITRQGSILPPFTLRQACPERSRRAQGERVGYENR